MRRKGHMKKKLLFTKKLIQKILSAICRYLGYILDIQLRKKNEYNQKIQEIIES